MQRSTIRSTPSPLPIGRATDDSPASRSGASRHAAHGPPSGPLVHPRRGCGAVVIRDAIAKAASSTAGAGSRDDDSRALGCSPAHNAGGRQRPHTSQPPPPHVRHPAAAFAARSAAVFAAPIVDSLLNAIICASKSSGFTSCGTRALAISVAHHRSAFTPSRVIAVDLMRLYWPWQKTAARHSLPHRALGARAGVQVWVGRQLLCEFSYGDRTV